MKKDPSKLKNQQKQQSETRIEKTKRLNWTEKNSPWLVSLGSPPMKIFLQPRKSNKKTRIRASDRERWVALRSLTQGSLHRARSSSRPSAWLRASMERAGSSKLGFLGFEGGRERERGVRFLGRSKKEPEIYWETYSRSLPFWILRKDRSAPLV